MKFKFIESDVELSSVCEMLLNEDIIGVDLEADSMHCFKEKICLIQIATNREAFLIDPFVIKHLDPFLGVLENKDVIKIFHGSDFDVRSIDREYGARIVNLFDTEIATRFLGVKERGLAALLKYHFNVHVDKKYQRVDWSQRPLKPEMIEYSVGDVSHLVQLYHIIFGQLNDNGRLSWAKEEFELQAKVRYESNYTLPFFKNFKGAGRMDNRALAALENLLQVRVKHAEKKDFPLFKIFSNASVKAIAEERITSVEKMIEYRMLSKRQAQMYGTDCANAVRQALEMPHGELPSYPKVRRPKKDPKVQERMRRLKRMREGLSASMDIEPGFLLNNSIIMAIAIENPKTKEELGALEPVRHWQAENIGDKILSVL